MSKGLRKSAVELDKSSRVLVTGGTGFIGSYLVEKLSREGFHPDVIAKETGDIRDENLDLGKYDVIYHMAAISSPMACEGDMRLAWDVNVSGTMNILDKLVGDQTLVFASTAHVYGPGRESKREDDPRKPGDFYGLTKKVCEDLIVYHGRRKGFRYAVLRFFNIYGPGQGRGFLIPDIVEKYRRGGEIKIMNPGAQRDFLYISDAVDALFLARDAQGIYNVGSGKGTKVEEAYRFIGREIGGERIHETVVRRKEDALIADTAQARRKLGWKPTVPWGEGIKATIESMLPRAEGKK